MKTIIDLPEDLLERTKTAAARRRTTLRKLVLEGLEMVLQQDIGLARLRTGYRLGGRPLSREESHGR